MKPTNVTRLLDAQNIPYTAYELPAEKLGAQETARLLDVPPEIVFKTIVVLREGKGRPNPHESAQKLPTHRGLGPILAVIPGPLEVDLKLLAQAIGEKKLHLPTEREAEAVTGLQAGGISPLALLNRGFQVLVDETCQLFDEIHISGGQRGLNIRLPVAALLELTGAQVAEIGK